MIFNLFINKYLKERPSEETTPKVQTEITSRANVMVDGIELNSPTQINYFTIHTLECYDMYGMF